MKTYRFAMYLLCGVVAFGAGGAVAHSASGADLVVLLVGLLVFACVLRYLGRGGAYAVLAIAAFDLFPGIDTATRQLHGGFFVSDVCTYLLIFSLLYEQAAAGFVAFRRGRELRLLGLWAAVLLLAWFANLLRSWIFDGVVLLHAYRFGDFLLYFALLTPLLSASLSNLKVRTNFLYVLGSYTVVIAAATTVSNLHPGAFQFLLHASVQDQQLEGTTVARTYAFSAGGLTMLALPFGLGAALLARDRRLRAAGALLAVLCAAATLTSLTRGQYIGLLAGVALPVATWLIWSARGQRVRRQVAIAVAAVTVLAALVVFIQPPAVSNSSLSVVASRITSIPGTLFGGNAQSSTVAYRVYEERVLEGYLGSKWPIGLGFLDPRDRFFVGLPIWDGGSIEDTDVGLLNTVMIMGVAGAVIQFAPAVVLLLLVLRQQIFRRTPREVAWLAFGGLGAMAALCVTSITLVFFFEPTTIVLCSIAVALPFSALEVRGRSRAMLDPAVVR